MSYLPSIDLTVVVAYLAAVVGLGLWLGRKHTTPDQFMAAGRSLPGWAIGLSMFWTEELIVLLRDHARELGCLAHLERAREIVRDGTSADNQIRVYHAALEAGASGHEAQVKVVDWLIEASLEGCPA